MNPDFNRNALAFADCLRATRKEHGCAERRPAFRISESTALLRLSYRIKALRTDKDWSQEQLAERASIQRSYVADLERGGRNPSVRTFVKMGVPGFGEGFI
jgi:ribosome-binding protein aMBF1 (putative translation factor)